MHRLYGREFRFANISFSPSRLLDLERFAKLPGLTDTLLAADTSPIARVSAHDWRAFKRTIEQLATPLFSPPS